MMPTDLVRRTLRAGVLLTALAIAATGCDDSDPADPDPRPETLTGSLLTPAEKGIL